MHWKLLAMDERRRIVLSFNDGTSFLTINPFRVADEIRRLVGDVASAKPNAAGSLIIIPTDEDQISSLLQEHQFLGRGASFDAPGSTVEAYAYAPSLSGVSDGELLAGLAAQGVVGVTRLRKRHDQPNPGIRLRFRGGTFPPTIRAGFEDFELRPWQRSPLLCRQCASYGHVKKHCRATYERCLRCSEAHKTDDCKSPSCHCPHCAEDHPAWDRRCKALEAYATRQGRLTQRAPAAAESLATAEASTQTSTSTRDAYTHTQKTATACRSCGTARASTTSTEAQTEDHSAGQEDIDPSEDPGWWRRRTRQDTRGVTAPPPIPERPERQKTTTAAESRPELSDPDFFPKVKSTKEDEEHSHIFKYEDGSIPARPTTLLFRFEASTRVVDLDLRIGTRAHRAAVNGFYFDRQYSGRRLYLRMY